MNTSITSRVSRSVASRPWVAIGGWIAILIAAIIAAGSLGDVVTQDERMLVQTESDSAAAIDSALRGSGSDSDTIHELVIVTATAGASFGSAEFSAALATVASQVGDLHGVEAVTVPTAADPFSVSPTGSSVLIGVNARYDLNEELGEQLLDIASHAALEGFQVRNYGQATADAVFDGLAEDTLIRGELIGISVALVILAVVFGALVASGIPLGIALISIISAVGATAVVGRAFELSFFVLNMIMMMGLALGIDYTLIAVQRFREELAKGRDVLDAIAVTGATATRAVLFSGVTVVIALIGLVVVPSTIMRSLGMGAIIVAITSMAAAVTLLPAVLALIGTRINKGRIPFRRAGSESRGWAAFARAVMSRPGIAATLSVALLATMALPMLSMRLTFPGMDSLPEDNVFRESVEILVDDFGMGQASTMVVIENASSAESEVALLAERIEAHPAFAETTVEWHGDTAFIDTRDTYDSADIRAEQAIATVRNELVPNTLAGTDAVANVGGEQADTVDFTQMIVDRVPLVLAIILGASLLLLLLAFRSVTIAAMSVAVNLLSAAATFGLLVAVFQYGWGAQVFGFAHVDGIAPWIPLFLFAVLFGLSMDYHVFLLSRIKEHHDLHGDTRAAVAFGLSRTGALITGAALIMVAVFSGFALGDLAEFQQMGFGLAAAVIIDATIVRGVLVPALLALFGRASWYLPSWLDWLPRLQIEAVIDEPVEAPTSVELTDRSAALV